MQVRVSKAPVPPSALDTAAEVQLCAEADLADRRAALAAAKARLWREHGAAASRGPAADPDTPGGQGRGREGAGVP